MPLEELHDLWAQNPCLLHASSASDAADGRHRGAHRPRQDVARPGADGEGHGPPSRGAATRDLDRSRLRAARASRRAPALRDRRSGPRALRAHDGRRRDRDRSLPARRRRGRGRASADARAPRDPAPARNRARCRRADEGRCRRCGDDRARRGRGARARPRSRGRARERAHGRGSRRASRRARRVSPTPSSTRARTARRGCTSIARSPSPASARS